MEYQFENELIQNLRLEISFSNIFNISNYAQEYSYCGGKVDIIARNNNGDIIVFEAKLYNWRKALNQAFRSTSFAHYSFVVMPPRKAQSLIKYKDEFEKNRVGLCTLTPKGIKVFIPARKNKPIQPWITLNASTFIDGDHLCPMTPNI